MKLRKAGIAALVAAATAFGARPSVSGSPGPGSGLAPGPAPAASVAFSPSPLALRSAWAQPDGTPPALQAPEPGPSAAAPPRLSAERARTLLRSLTVPGWGQAHLGHRGAAAAFALAELGVWTSYTSFRIQEVLRRHGYEETARLFAGIDLEGRDEEFRRVVGQYPSSELYNILVVRRQAANLWYGDPAAYNDYIAKHELTGSDTWSWDSPESFGRYRSQRQRAQRAAQRANTALAVAMANRLLSVLHAARLSQHGALPSPTSWKLEVAPAPSDPSILQIGVSARF